MSKSGGVASGVRERRAGGGRGATSTPKEPTLSKNGKRVGSQPLSAEEKAARVAAKKAGAKKPALAVSVAARRETFDRKYGAYSEASLNRHMKALIQRYPEVQAALDLHVQGKDAARAGQKVELSPESIASVRPYVHVNNRAGGITLRPVVVEGDRMQRARTAFQQIKELSQWSLLHSKRLNPDGTITLYHGADGTTRGGSRLARYEQGSYRRGTSFTDDPHMAATFAQKGSVVRADVPVSSIVAWYHMLTGGYKRGPIYEQHEYVLDSGRLRNVAYHAEDAAPASKSTSRRISRKKTVG